VIIETAGLVLLTVVAALLLTPLIRAALRQRAMDRWPRVTGFVEGHHVREEANGTAYPEHQVRYQTAGREFVSMCGEPNRAGYTNYRRGTRTSFVRAAVKRRLDRHPVGQTVVVMANPANPAEAFIVQRELPLTAIAAAATVILVGFIVATARILFLP
jgi:Protein of unknown function (DUF3592)